ncbi:conserved hypothetical protein [Sporisorium reilianum SRZ2]|uniref:RING-type domain-containing protein n=1 Tax=Sporisorium reilianum (strain SRZ2) TaxID=999809 RepID=E6ZMX4_SPORE|nr:conserved hypothetical protein [Sporisorium reilianum SRZ2]
MDHLALFDGFAASTSLDLTGLPAAAADLDRSSSCRRDTDKGKARACDDFDDDSAFQPMISGPAESSRSARSLSALSDNGSRLRDSRSADHSDSKGKARQLFTDAHAPASASACATDSQCLRRSWTSTSSQRSASVSASYHDEASLKRSIRQMGSSPSSSPRQHTRLLPPTQACGSTSQLSLDLFTTDAPSTSSLPVPSASTHARPGTPNKKRRSFRTGGDDDEQHTPRAPAVEAQPADTSLRSESHTRRASLLVNSSTRDSHSFDSNPTLCVSPEPMDSLTRSEQASSDLSHRRSAFLVSARAQRSNSSIRRRRGFYLRDADLLRNDPTEENLVSSSSRPNSSTSDTFMAEFARAVDLRLAAQPSARTPSSANTPRAHHHHASRLASTQPDAPQLPYPRTASPLTISFAAVEADELRQEAQRGLTARPTSRRRIPAPVFGRSLQADQDGASLTPRRTAFDLASWESSSTHQPDRASTQREAHAWRVETRRADAASTPESERLDARRPYHVSLSAAHAALESHTSDHTTADDFGAVQRPFGLRGSRLTRRPYRSRVEDNLEAGHSAVAEAERENAAHLRRRDADHSADRQADEAPDYPPPWRRSHFGVRAPSRLPERNVSISTTQPRFEPFAENPNGEPRRSTGLASSRSSLSSSLYRERHESESALEYLGRLMSHDSMLDEWMAGDVHGPLLRMAIESEVLQSYPHLRHLGHTPASTSSMFGQSPHLAFDARNFIADEDWAELSSYEGLMQLGERLGAAEICVPQSLIDTLPTCEYGKWDGGSCRQRDALSASPPLVGKGKGKQKVEPPPSARDTMCPICREDYLDSDMLMSINKCCHAFHADCIKTWFKTAKTCPLCRADAFDEISLPALPFESTSSTTATARTATLGGGSSHPTWSFNF